jgi:hypothetical protein
MKYAGRIAMPVKMRQEFVIDINAVYRRAHLGSQQTLEYCYGYYTYGRKPVDEVARRHASGAWRSNERRR